MRKCGFPGWLKNFAQQTTLFARSNLWMMRKRLLAMGDGRL